MSRETRFSWDSEEQKAEFEAYAKARGLTLSAFAKWACFQAKSRNRTGSHHGSNGSGRTTAPLTESGVSDDS